MAHFRSIERRANIIRHDEDIPRIEVGLLIPRSRVETLQEEPVTVVVKRTVFYMRPAFIFTLSIVVFGLSLGSAGYSVLRGEQSVAAPIVVLNTNDVPEQRELNYGVHAELGHEDFFEETLATFIEQAQTFFEANLIDMTLTYYENGVATDTVKILAKGQEGTWWETPAGLYEIEKKKVKHYSSFDRVYQPWNLTFQGNFFIHGIPYHQNGVDVDEEYVGGGIRVSDEDAERLYEYAKIGTPVLVYEEHFKSDDFLYEPKIPGNDISHYLVADIKNSTILASSDADIQLPIASLTKLMTALVAAESISLDQTVTVYGTTSTSSVPRFRSGQHISLHSLLQLLLLESSNEAADRIADVVGRRTFVNLMNEKAATIGLSDTVFMDPSGLDDGNVSTLGDLLKLMQYIYDNRSFVLLMTADQYAPNLYTKNYFGELLNFNTPEGLEETFVGGKIGKTTAAGQTSISLHTITIDEEERVIAIIVLGSNSRTKDVNFLYQYVVEQFSDEHSL